MSLALVAEPQTESELAVTLCVLEAAGIPAFVSSGFGSVYPGPQIPSYNAHRVLVPSACRDDAAAALEVLQPPLPDRTRWRDRIRVLIEFFLLFGWFIPGHRRRSDDADLNDVAAADAPLTSGEQAP
jgi:hypothetical protein